MKCIQLIFTFVILITSTTLTAAELELETGWLRSELGNKEDVLGASVTNVQDDAQKLTISIPKKQAPNIEHIEEVIVVGQKPEKVKLPTIRKIKYEFIKDYDNDNYGLVIYLGKRHQIPFRLYLKGQELEE